MTRKFGPRSTAVAIAAALFAASFSLPAFGADSPLTIAKKALKKANSADKRSKTVQSQLAALQRQPGPAGAAGAAGPSGPPGAPGTAGAKGDQGGAGADGTDGTDGTDGNDGDDGSATRARARKSGGDFTVTPANSFVTVPLTGNTYTPVAGETDQVLVTITGTAPATCTGGTGVQFDVKLNGQMVQGSSGANTVGFSPGSFSKSYVAGFVIDPPTSLHTVTLEAAHNCSGGGESYTITDVKINVIAAI